MSEQQCADYSYGCGCYWFSGNVVACPAHSPHAQFRKLDGPAGERRCSEDANAATSHVETATRSTESTGIVTSLSQIACPACGDVVKQVSSATLNLALSQHYRWVCRKNPRDLLAALKLIESIYRKNCVAVGEPSSVLDAVQAAIAKAEET